MIRWFFVLWIWQYLGNASPSTCILERVPDLSSITTYQLTTAINDTYRGNLAVFRTKNIQRVKILENKYFNVTWSNQILTLATGFNFDLYETESGYTAQPSISVMLHFDCTQDQEKDLIIVQKINDTNNHAPILNQNAFTYVFGMTVPKGFVLTDIVPIKAVDNDVSNGQIYFEIPTNEFVQIQHKGTPRSYSLKEFSTKLIALNEIVAPFHQQFTLLVTDGDNPSRQISSTITITVATPEKLNAKDDNKFFVKHLYYAQYGFNRKLEMQEKVLIRTDANVILRLKGYKNYFNVTLRNSEVIVNNVKPLSLDSFKLDFIALEVEALDNNFHRLKGRTTILVQLPRYTGRGNQLISYGISFNPVVLSAIVILLLMYITFRKRLCTILDYFFSKEKSF